MVSKSEAKQSDYSPQPLRDSQMNAGIDEGEQIAANTTAEVADIQVGDDAALEEVVAVLMGRPTDPQIRSRQGKCGGLFKSDGTTDLPDDVECRLIARRPKSRGPAAVLSEWLDHGELNDDDGKGVLPFPPRKPFVREGFVIALEMRRPGGSFTYSHSDSTFKFPMQGGV